MGQPANTPRFDLQAMRRLVGVARPHRRAFALALLLTTAASSILLVIPLGLRELLDGAIRGANRPLLAKLALGLFGLYAVRGIINLFGQYTLKVTAERVVNDLRVTAYAHLHSLDLGFFAQNRVSELISRITNDIAIIRSALSDSAANGIMTVCRLVGSVVVMLFISPRLAALVFVVVPVVALLTRQFAQRIRTLSAKLQDGLAETTVVAQEGLAGVRLVQSFARQDYEVTRYRGAIGTMFVSTCRMLMIGTLLTTIMESLFTVVLIGIYWYGGGQVIDGRMSAGDLVASVFYAQNLAQGIGDVVQLFVSYATVSGACARVFGLLDTRTRVREPVVSRALPRRASALRFDGVSFEYDGSRPVLHDVSFEIREGETVAIVGVSGAGKTTLLNLIPRLMDTTRGSVRINGTDVRDFGLDALRKHIAIVSQDTYLFNSSIRANLRYGDLSATNDEVELAARRANAHEFIESLPLGYESTAGELGIRLSGGQRQRIAIARALLKDAPILLLDEATSSLDAANEAAIQDAVRQLQLGRTTILVTHRLSALRGIDRILVLEDGQITADGTHEHLMMQSQLYASLVNATAAPHGVLQPI